MPPNITDNSDKLNSLLIKFKQTYPEHLRVIDRFNERLHVDSPVKHTVVK